MDTKLKGDIAEQTAILQALKRGWGVLKPVGDRLPYDLVFDVSGLSSRFKSNPLGLIVCAAITSWIIGALRLTVR